LVIFLIVRLPNYDKNREHVELESYITLNNATVVVVIWLTLVERRGLKIRFHYGIRVSLYSPEFFL
jgi:hypothetical protein